MGTWTGDEKARARARAQRDADADKQLKHRSGGFLSWGGSGRAETKPGLFGLGSRVVNDIEQENAKSGWFGQRGGKAVAARAARADRSGKSRSTKSTSWFS